MIRSRIWTTPDPSTPDRASDVWFLLGALLLVSLLVQVIRPATLLPLDIFLWRPILACTALLAAGQWLVYWQKKTWSQVWDTLKAALPFALVSSLVFALINLWQQGSGSMPLTLSQLPVYLLSLGFWPTIAGPESLLRGFALGLALGVAWHEYRATKNDLRTIVGAVGTWLACSLVLLLPSITIILALLFQGLPILNQTGQDIVENFSRLNLNTYWSNLQLTRWFTGFGGQLPNMMALFQITWVAVIALAVTWIVSGLTKFKTWSIKNILSQSWDIAIWVTAILAGLSAGWGRMPHSPLDWATWLAFLISMVLLFMFWRTKIMEEVQSEGESLFTYWHLPLVLIFAALLGWPIMQFVVAILIISWLYKKSSRVREQGWLKDIILWLIWMLIASASLAFVRGSQTIGLSMVNAVMAFGLLVAPALIWRSAQGKAHSWFITASCWLVASLIAAYLLQAFAVFALALLVVVFCYILFRLKDKTGQVMPLAIILYTLAVLIFIFWLPRWLNPRLLPL
ncbi:MAG: hypothetical protein PHC53_02060 [Patescibacteria group bacterium]|nr:hypothetical protein [Patescibacteria group bacterium]